MSYTRLDELYSLHNRLVDDYNEDKQFEQMEEDRLLTYDLIKKIESYQLVELPCIVYNVKECRYQIVSTNNGRIYAGRLYRDRKEAEAKLKKLQEE